MSFTPPYPKPHRSKSSFLLRFVRGWRSWLDVLFERSYRMKMGHYRQPGLDVYMVNQPCWVRRILVEEPDAYPKHQLMHRMLEPLLGESIFTTNGDVWARQRRLMDQAFEQARLKLVFPLMMASVDDMLERLDGVADGSSYEVDGEMTYVTADIIFRTILSEHLAEADARAIYEAFIEFQHHAQRAMVLMIYRLPAWLPRRASERCAKRIRAVLAEIILRRYQARERGETDERVDILGALMDAVDPVQGDRFSYDEMVDQICMLFLAGHETSASSLAWALYLISRDPELQARLVDEIDAVAGTRPFEFSDIKRMRLVWDTFREALRLYPPVGFFVREARESQCIRDKQVKAGSPILVSPWLIHRHEEYWERPHEFDPDRFATDSGKDSLKNAYLPFSMGPRVCIGAAFATQEAVLILANILRRYRVDADVSHTPQTVGRVTIRSDNGIRVRLTPRRTAT
ncbi:MAG: cytochrome P450 [Gammaproteobacteria bacterium]|jgi:cytochrome P450|nr:cytochrome P450 [Gammaproteobacteria bacterium]